MVAVWAYAYEVLHESLVEDHVYDEEAMLINPVIDTGRADLDNFFRTEYFPHTGMWVLNHPEKEKLHRIAQELIARKKSRGKKVRVRSRNEAKVGGMFIQ